MSDKLESFIFYICCYLHWSQEIALWKHHCYCPQMKVMFLHMSVILSTGGVPGPRGCLALGGSAWSGGVCRPTTKDEVEGDLVQAHTKGEVGNLVQAHTQGGSWGGSGPGPHPRGKLRGNWPAPPTATAEGGMHPTGMHSCCFLFRWFKFTLKPPYSIALDNLRLDIWDTSFWTFRLKFGHKGPWHIS